MADRCRDIGPPRNAIRFRWPRSRTQFRRTPATTARISTFFLRVKTASIRSIARIGLRAIERILAVFTRKKNVEIRAVVAGVLRNCVRDLGHLNRIALRGGPMSRHLSAIHTELRGPHLSLIHISEPTRQAEISYAVF